MLSQISAVHATPFSFSKIKIGTQFNLNEVRLPKQNTIFTKKTFENIMSFDYIYRSTSSQGDSHVGLMQKV
jgi:hypothetical protein